MGKNIKFLKKLTSLVLTGLTIFSSVPVKAWKPKAEKIREPRWGSKYFPAKAFEEEDPRKVIEAELKEKHEKGYVRITAQDVNEQLEYATHASFWDDYDEKLDVGKIIADFCNRKHIDYRKVISIDFIPFSGKEYTNNKFYVESLGRFSNLINFNMNCENMQLSAHAFMDNVNLKLVDFSGLFTKFKIISYERERYIRNGGWYRGTYGPLKFASLGGDNANTYGEKIDLFKPCIDPVTLICSSNVERNFFIDFMGDEGKRHTLYCYEELDQRYDLPISLNEFEKEVPKLITSEFLGNYRYLSQNNPNEKNIIIPNNVKKIEAGAFKNSGVMSVTFEEGIHALELGDECFAGCPLVKFELPKSLKYLKVGKDCFKGCLNSGDLNNYVNACRKATDEYQEKMRKYNSDKKIHKEDAKEKRRIKEEAEKLEQERQAAKERIDIKIKEVKESIEKIENNQKKKVAEAHLITFKDKLEKLFLEKQEETNTAIIALQKDYYTAECNLAESVLKRFKTKLNCKKDLLDTLEKNLKDLETTEDINSLWETLQNKEVEANSKLKEAKRLYEEAMMLRDKADDTLREANEKEQENNRMKKELEEQKEMQAREQQRLDEERKKLEEEKNKGLFSRLGEKINSLNPIKSVTDTLGNMGHKVVVGCKIALGAGATVLGLMGIGLVVKTVTSVINFCTSVKKLFTSKSKKEVHQKPSNSTSNTLATPV